MNRVLIYRGFCEIPLDVLIEMNPRFLCVALSLLDYRNSMNNADIYTDR